MSPGPSRRWRTSGQMVLLLVVLAWMPLGAREADVASTTLPALHPASVDRAGAGLDVVAHVDGAPRPAVERGRRIVADIVAGPLGPVAVVALAALVTAPRRVPATRPLGGGWDRAPPLPG